MSHAEFLQLLEHARELRITCTAMMHSVKVTNSADDRNAHRWVMAAKHATQLLIEIEAMELDYRDEEINRRTMR